MFGIKYAKRPLVHYGVSAATFIGRRPKNDDACLACRGRNWALLAVADGMGGLAGGGLASNTAIREVDALAAWLRTANRDVSAPEVKARLLRLFSDANRGIYEHPSKDGTFTEMGTTLVVAVAVGRSLFVGHVGDSRAYLLNANGVIRLTQDHNIAQARKEAGIEENMGFGQALTKSLGDTPSVEPDIYPANIPGPDDTVAGIKVDVAPEGAENGGLADGEHLLEDGNAIIVCSDGAWGVLEDADLAMLLQRAANPKVASRLIVHEAFHRGSHDNISVGVMEIGKMPRAAKVFHRVPWPPAAGPVLCLEPIRQFFAQNYRGFIAGFLSCLLLFLIVIAIWVVAAALDLSESNDGTRIYTPKEIQGGK